MKTYYTKLRLAIALACGHSFVTHAATALAEQRPDIIALARHIQENGPTRITKAHGKELKRIAEKHTPKFKEKARYFGFIERLDSGNRNPVCIPEIRKNIIEFLGVPSLSFVPCPDLHDQDSDWHTNWPAKCGIPCPSPLLVACKPIDIGWGGIYIYDRSTGKKIHHQEGESLQCLGGIGPIITITTNPHPASTKDLPLYDTTVTVKDIDEMNHYHTFMKRKAGLLYPRATKGHVIFHNHEKHEQELYNMSVPQALAICTINELANKGVKLAEGEPLLNVLTASQKDNIVRLSGIIIKPSQAKISRKRKSSSLRATKLFLTPHEKRAARILSLLKTPQ